MEKNRLYLEKEVLGLVNKETITKWNQETCSGEVRFRYNGKLICHDKDKLLDLVLFSEAAGKRPLEPRSQQVLTDSQIRWIKGEVEPFPIEGQAPKSVTADPKNPLVIKKDGFIRLFPLA